MPCYLLANMNVLENDFTKIRFKPELNFECFLGKHVVDYYPFSEFDNENSTKDAFSDILKSIVQNFPDELPHI